MRNTNIVSVFDVSAGSLLVDNTRGLFFEVCGVDFLHNSLSYVADDEVVTVAVEDISPVELNLFSVKDTFDFVETDSVEEGVEHVFFLQNEFAELSLHIREGDGCCLYIHTSTFLDNTKGFKVEGVMYLHTLQNVFLKLVGKPLLRSSSYLTSLRPKCLTQSFKTRLYSNVRLTKQQVDEVLRVFKNDENNTVPDICKKLKLKRHQVHKVLNEYYNGLLPYIPTAYVESINIVAL